MDIRVSLKYKWSELHAVLLPPVPVNHIYNYDHDNNGNTLINIVCSLFVQLRCMSIACASALFNVPNEKRVYVFTFEKVLDPATFLNHSEPSQSASS